VFPRSHRNRFGVIYAEATIDPHIINIMSLSTMNVRGLLLSLCAASFSFHYEHDVGVEGR
jgi:hypothetical protein